MISVSGLKKSFGAIQALKGIDFEVNRGELFGLLGPNGAGKTTTISIMSTILKPDGGNVVINGLDLGHDTLRFKKMIGVVPQEIALYDDLSATENLMFWGSLYNISKPVLKQTIEKTLKLFGLYDRRDYKIKTYSGGMKRRINIASAILHNPEVLFMDEPTVGIDPQSRNLIFEVITELHNQGMTIIYTTHYMEEAERLCNRTGIIDDGLIIANGTLEELRNLSRLQETITITFAESVIVDLNKLSIDGIDMQTDQNLLHCYTGNLQAALPKIIQRCSELDLSILNVNIQKINLETIFLHLTGKKLRD